MKHMPMSSKGLLAAGAMLALLGSAVPSAALADPDFVLDLPAGLACANFDLRLEVTENPNRVYREFYDKSGNLVRYISAGKGNDLTVMNLFTGARLTLKANGSVEKTHFNPDGTITSTAMGHNLIIFFPTDNPPGPTTTLYVGRVVWTVDTSGVWTLVSTAGNSTDICAELE
jgi:hypothetical protein